MIFELILAYTTFILISALPVLAPAIILVLLWKGIALLAGSSGAPGRAAGILCLGTAGLIALIVFGFDERIPGTREFRDLRAGVEQQQRAQRALAPGGEFTVLRESIHGKRTCRWEQEPGAWVRRCVDER